MTDQFPQTQYNVSSKSKLKIFYEDNKKYIFSAISIFVIIISVLTFYLYNKENKKILLSENYIQAKIYAGDGNKKEATDLLKKIIFSNDSTYSTLSFFLILNQKLINDHNEISKLFDHLIANNNYTDEIHDLLIYKKALFNSDFVNETELLKDLKPIISTESLWKPHALLLIGNYYVSNKEYIKAIEFYNQILSTKNLPIDFYNEAKLQLVLIENE